MKYVLPGHGVIGVSAEERNGFVHLSVEDNGIGIPSEFHATIFRLFGRVPVKDQIVAGQPAAGSGVGLAIVKQVAEMHGGHVTVDSAPGRGSRFEVALPIDTSGSHHG